MASSSQLRDRLEEGKSKNDTMFIYMWKKKARGKGKSGKKNKRKQRCRYTKKVGI